MSGLDPRLASCAAASKPAEGTEAALVVVRRLLQTLQDENAALRLTRGMIDHTEYNIRKSQALLALNRCASKLAHGEANPALQGALEELIIELETNG